MSSIYNDSTPHEIETSYKPHSKQQRYQSLDYSSVHKNQNKIKSSSKPNDYSHLYNKYHSN
jgi:hypothetical protein